MEYLSKKFEKEAKKIIIDYLVKIDSLTYVNDTYESLLEYRKNSFDKSNKFFGLIEDVILFMESEDCDRIEEEITIIGKYAFCDEFPLSNLDFEDKSKIIKSLN